MSLKPWRNGLFAPAQATGCPPSCTMGGNLFKKNNMALKDQEKEYLSYKEEWGKVLQKEQGVSKTSPLVWEGMTLKEYALRREWYGWLHNLDQTEESELMEDMMCNLSDNWHTGTHADVSEQIGYNKWEGFEDYLNRGLESLADELGV